MKDLYSLKRPIGLIPPNLHDHLVTHPADTYFARASSDTMIKLGICAGDLLVVDRAITPQHGDLVIALLNGERNCKVLDIHERRLLSANDEIPPIAIDDVDFLVIEGVVSASIRYHRQGGA